MTLIDGDRVVTAQLYDDKHEEFTEEKMSIIDYVNAYTTEGVTTADDVLDKIRAEIEQIEGNEVEVSDMQGNRYKYETIVKAEVLQIIDKYKAESEEER